MAEDLFAQPEFAEADDDGDDDDGDDQGAADVFAEDAAPDDEADDGTAGDEADDGTAGDEADDGTAGDEGNAARGGAARAVLVHVTSALVSDPDAVVVDLTENRSGLRFAVRVAPGDMGRVIGRRGRTVQAIRTLVRAAAAGEGLEASVAVDD